MSVWSAATAGVELTSKEHAMGLELTDQQAVLVARDAEVQRRRQGYTYSQDLINSLDAWFGYVMHFQRLEAIGEKQP